MNNAEIITALKAHALRPTQQRIAIYRYLLEHPSHPTAEMIYNALHPSLPSCSLMTVYNGLEALHDAGLIRVVTIEAGIRRFDGNEQVHGHFQCTRCGTIYDFPLPPQNTQIRFLDSFRVLDENYYCSGICPDCHNNHETQKSK